MTPRQIIAEAWAITNREKTLRRWGFTSALFETLRNVEMLLYQAYYLYWYSKGVTVGWISVEQAFFEHLPFWLFVTVTAIIVLLLVLQLFIPTICTGALIGLSAKAYRKEEAKGGLVLGLYNFFPILELHGLFVLSSLGLTVTLLSTVYRYGDVLGNIKEYVLIGIGALWLFTSFFRFFASFAEEDIVLRKRGVFAAVGTSFKLILSHLGHIMFIILLLLVISVRILINAVLVFLLPAIAIGIGLLLTTFLSAETSTVIAAVIGLFLLVFVSYFFAYLHVFKQTVWTLTYLELSSRKDVDAILED